MNDHYRRTDELQRKAIWWARFSIVFAIIAVISSVVSLVLGHMS